MLFQENLCLTRKIAQNQPGRSTWEAEHDGKKCVVKMIETENPHQKQKLVEILSRQVQYHEKIALEDRARIVLFNEMIESESSLAFVRNWVEGESLEDHLSPDPMPWEKAATLVGKIADIVELAHTQYAIFHGDLKPANIIISQEEMSIIDWDSMRIAYEMDDMATKTLSLEALGTPYYMAPEQCRGRNINAQSDVYALGAIFYRLLTGVLPFGDTPVLQLWTLKQSEELPPILTSFPSLHLPMEIGMLVDDALLMDPNYRIQTVRTFKERLNNALKMDTLARAEPLSFVPMPSSAPSGSTPLDPHDEKTLSGKLLIFGHTQAGKTVLATGLYSTSSKQFQVIPLGTDTQNFVQNVKTVLDNNSWPSATQGTLMDLRFKLLYKRWHGAREAIVTFKEYGGERVSREDFARSVVGKPEGVLFLFNPYTMQKKETYEQNKIVGEIKKCINLLAKMSPKPQVAVVITAADTLTNSAKEFRPQFEKIVGDISASLTLMKMDWRRFEVSVCRPLEDQSKPHIDPQGIQEPFLWLLGKKQSAFRWRIARYTACCLACILLFAALILGIGYQHDRMKLSRVRDKFAQIEQTHSIRTSLDSKKAYTDQLHEFVRTIPTEMWYITNAEAFSQLEGEIHAKADAAFFEYLSDRMKTTSGGIPDFNAWSKELANWEPLCEQNLGMKRELEMRQTELLPQMIEKSVAWVAEGKAKNSDEFESRYQNVLEFFKRFSEKTPKVREAFHSKIAPLRESVLQARIDTFVGTPQQLSALLEECRIYAEQELNQEFSQTKLAASILSICRNRIGEEIQRLSQEIADTSKPLDIDYSKLNVYSGIVEGGGFAPSSVQEVKQQISSFVDGVDTEREKAEQRTVDSFIRDIKDVDAVEALNKLKFWLLEDASGLRADIKMLAEKEVEEKVVTTRDTLISNCFTSAQENDFLALKSFCQAIKATSSEHIKKTDSFSFANKYISWFENESTLSIRLVELRASCTHEHGGYIHKINGAEGPYGKFWTKNVYRSSTKIERDGDKSATLCKPWKSYWIELDLYVNDCTPPIWDTGGSYPCSFRPTSRTDNVTTWKFESLETTVEAIFEVNGKTFLDLYRECFGE
ncbi:MAG: serine/threonine-protein kinase [Planctomycetia bacterium]|nr:serine/threonine-protein kinase [Planctomycetia bacterium]